MVNSVTVQMLVYGTLFSVWEGPPFDRPNDTLRFDGAVHDSPIGNTRLLMTALEACVLFLTFFSTTTSPFGQSGITILIWPEQHWSVPGLSPPPALVALAFRMTVWPGVAPVIVQVVVAAQGCCGGVTVTPAVCEVSVISVPVKLLPLSVSV